MKQFLTITMVAGSAVMLFAGSALAQTKAPKTEKHIKIVKVDDNGNKIELDTVINGNEAFVWNGDTIGGGKDMMWITKNDFKLDSAFQNEDMNFEFNMNDDGNGNVVIMKSGKGGDRMMMVPPAPGAPFPPNAPRVMMFKGKQNRNVIDLSDPGIISYDKKLRKDGTEKITIVRKQVPEVDEEMEDIMMQAPHGGNAYFYDDAPKHVKTIKVIKDDDGNTKVMEDGEVIRIHGDKDGAKFISDDGKVIYIKETKEGDQKKVEVTVEEEEKK